MTTPNTNSHISWHLSDRVLFPIASSDSSNQTPRPQLPSITSSALTAYDSASRLGLGLPQRIIVETRADGPILLHSYLNPPPVRTRPRQPGSRSGEQENGRTIIKAARDDLRPLSAGTQSTVGVNVNGLDYGEEGEDEEEEGEDVAVQRPPLLVGTVVAESPAQMLEARRAAADLERFGRQFQRDLVRHNAETDEVATAEAD